MFDQKKKIDQPMYGQKKEIDQPKYRQKKEIDQPIRQRQDFSETLEKLRMGGWSVMGAFGL